MTRFFTAPLRALRQPRWIVLGIVTLILTGTFVSLGLWQLDRLEQRRDANALILSARNSNPVPLGELLSLDASLASRDEYAQVTATGRYDADNQILVRNRSIEERPGFFILTPLSLESGGTVLIARGWIPLSPDGADTPPDVPEVPTGDVHITGRVRVSEDHDADLVQLGQYTALRAINLATLRKQLDTPLYQTYIELAEHTHTDGSVISEEKAPALIPEQALDEGPHLSYAIQWFSFATIALGGCAVLLYRAGREQNSRNTPNTTSVPEPSTGRDMERSKV